MALNDALVLLGGAIGWGGFSLAVGIVAGDMRVGGVVFLAIIGAFAFLLSLASHD